MTNSSPSKSLFVLRLSLLCSIILMGSCFSSSNSHAAERLSKDWNQLRGPNGQGYATTEVDAPLTWSETENIAWKSAVPGKGWSSPVVSGNKIWLTTATEEGKTLRAVAFDLKTGNLLHNVELFNREESLHVNTQNSHASPTPVSEPGFVYLHFGTMGTACLNSETGDIVWKHEKLRIDHKEGPGSSPILFNNFLIINCDGMDQQYVVALDKQTGEIVWKTKRSGELRERPDFRKAYATPTMHKVDGRWQVISPGSDQIEGYDAHTGEEIWRVRYHGFSNVPLVVINENVAYVCTGFTKSQLWAIDVTGKGDVTDTHVLWSFKRQVPQISSPIYADGKLYFSSDKGVGCCVDAKTGKPLWQDRLGGNFSASPVAVKGHLLFSNHNGKTLIIKPDNKLNIVRTNELDGHLKATPALVDNSLIIRTDAFLYRISKSK